MRKFILLLLGSYSFYATMAQKYSHEFGNINMEELQLNRYEKDTSAEAVVIYDIGKSYFLATADNKFDLYFERKTKIKIFNKAGYKFADIRIPFYVTKDDEEQIMDLRGYTYNIDNGQIKTTVLNSDNSYNEKTNAHLYYRKVAMPDIKEGSVFEITYKIKTPYNVNFQPWAFQNLIPVIYSEYTARMIPFYDYITILQGNSKYDEYKCYVDESVQHHSFINYYDKVYVFAMNNIPAFRDELFITSYQDYIIKLNFQLAIVHYEFGPDKEFLSTWPKLAEELMDAKEIMNDKPYSDYIRESSNISKKMLETMHLDGLTIPAKAKCIDRFVKNYFTWNQEDDFFVSKNVKELISSKTGNCAEINLFLTGILRSLGLEAYPVLISTRDYGKVHIDYPFLYTFNYVVVCAKIDSSILLLDATEPLSNFNEIPTRCINDYGLIVQKKKEAEWLQIKSNILSNVEYDFILTPDETMDHIINDCRLNTTGYEAIDYRKQFSSSYNKLKEQLLGNNSVSDDSVHMKNLHQTEKPFTLQFKEKIKTESLENKILISPFNNKPITENPLKMPTREYPIDLIYKKIYTYRSTIMIPQGYKLFSKPDDMQIHNNMVNIVYKVDVISAGVIMVAGKYEFKKDIYEASQYNDLKNYYNKIIDKFNEKLVFVKD